MGALHRGAVYRGDDVAGPDAGASRGAAHLLDDEPPVDARFLALIGGKRPHGEAELAAALGRARLGLGGLLLLHGADRDADLARLARAQDVHLRLRAGLDLRDERRELARLVDRLAVEADDDVAGLEAGLLRRAAGLDLGDERAARSVEAEGLGERRRYFLHADAEASALDLAVREQLLLDADRRIDRDGEGDALEAARARVDLRVDADHLALHVEERPAGVARVHRRVRSEAR